MSGGLLASEITVRYGSHTAVDRVSVRVDPGRVVGLIGPNGAGKTSFIDAVTGITPMAGGTVMLDDVDVTRWPPHRRARQGVRRTFQGNRLFDDLTVRENLIVASETTRRFGFVRDLFRPQPSQVSADQILEMIGLSDLAEALPRSLPAGTRRLVGVARALVARPRVVLLDEPAAGLDSHETQELGRILRDLAATGVGLLLVEHDTDLVFRICDEVVAIDFGNTIASGPAHEVRSSEAVIAAYLGTPETEGSS